MLERLFGDFGQGIPERLAAVPVLAWVVIVLSLAVNFTASPIAKRLKDQEADINKLTAILKGASLLLLVVGFLLIMYV